MASEGVEEVVGKTEAEVGAVWAGAEVAAMALARVAGEMAAVETAEEATAVADWALVAVVERVPGMVEAGKA